MVDKKTKTYVLNVFAKGVADTVRGWKKNPNPTKKNLFNLAFENWATAASTCILRLDGEEIKKIFDGLPAKEKISELTDTNLSFRMFLGVAQELFEKDMSASRS